MHFYKSGRGSLLAHVLYCAGSLGQPGGDFSLMLAFLGDENEDEEGEGEWVDRG